MGKPFAKEDLVGMFSEALGNDKAQQLIEEAIRILGLQQKNSFEREDILAIAKELKRKGGFIAILANCLASQAFHVTKQDQSD